MLRTTHNLIGHTAEQHTGDTAVSVGRQCNQIDRMILGVVEDGAMRLCDDKLRLHLE